MTFYRHLKDWRSSVGIGVVTLYYSAHLPPEANHEDKRSHYTRADCAVKVNEEWEG